MGAGLSSKVLELRRRYERWELRRMGMEERVVELDEGSTIIHCWVPSGWQAKLAGDAETKVIRAAAGIKDCHDHGGDIRGAPGAGNDYDREEKRDDDGGDGREEKHDNDDHHDEDDGGDDDNREEKNDYHHHHDDDDDDDGNGDDDKVIVLLHGFGAEGMAWAAQVAALRERGYHVFMPDLLFFGRSSTRRGERSEAFQAECVVGALRRLGVRRTAAVVGHSYGGFVAYRMAHLHPRFVRRVVLVSSGVAMNPRSNDAVLAKARAPSIEHVLVPPTVQAFSTTLSLICYPLRPYAPEYLHPAMHKLMQGDSQRRLELVHGIILGKENAPPLPKLKQDVLIIWGDQDQIFDVQLAHELKEFLQPKAELILFKDVGHAPIIIMRELHQKIIEFLER